MQVLRGHSNPSGQPCVLSIGNFDGLHLGHRALLRLLVDKASALGLPASVLTFEPHPREYFAPDDVPARLTSLREKLLLLADCGVERVHVQRFDASLARLSAQAFIDSVLVRGLRARHVFVGDDFRFGSGRDGNFAMLQAAGSRHGFEVESMPTLTIAGERVSSSALRQALAAGEMEHATRLLGRPYSLAGRVRHGARLGRKLGFPTLNVPFYHRRPALSGVFAAAVEGVAATRQAAVVNIGWRPSVTKTPQPQLEAHLIDWAGICYGAFVRVHLFHKLRDEICFPSLDALKTQIGRDREAARDWLTQHPDALRG
ncbi:MAG: bifunctional riboflavin kinase/FAD synthetase [Azoarcus sp.]|jgi:riboflavin kinase/FMN adenylyltransferase|nr:bifunctional riboflavin kinase/FAD synthetase [Azoarcus sp.]